MKGLNLLSLSDLGMLAVIASVIIDAISLGWGRGPRRGR